MKYKLLSETTKKTIGVLLWLASVLAFTYVNMVDVPNLKARMAIHNQIIHGTALSPYRYRVLVPHLTQSLVWLFAHLLSARLSFILAYALFDFICLWFLFLMLYKLLIEWFSPSRTLLMLTVVAVTMPVAFKDHYYQPWSLLEPGLFTLGLWLLYQKRYDYFALVTCIASLNRETGVFLWLAYLVTAFGPSTVQPGSRTDSTQRVWHVVNLAVWPVVFFGLRYLLGAAPQTDTVMGYWVQNKQLSNLRYTVSNHLQFIGLLWIMFILGWPYANAFIKRCAFTIPVFLLSVLLFSCWWEVRPLMSLYPFLLPICLGFFNYFDKDHLTASEAVRV